MPIREYECKDCSLKFESIELGTETEKVTCPRCHSENIEKKFSLFARSYKHGGSCEVPRGFG